MKKIALLIALTMIISSFAMPVFADVNEENLDVRFLVNFGLLGDTEEVFYEDIPQNDPITRLDFAKMFYGIIFDNPPAEYNGNLNFTDVPAEMMQVVSTVYDLGIMKGYSDTVFGSNDTITYNQAVKAIVSFLGYDVQAQEYGGFPGGYLIQASILDILPDVNVAGDTEATISMVATMFKKALEVDYSTTDGSEQVVLKNVNYLHYFKSIKTTSGVITANYLTNTQGGKAVDYFSVNVNGVKMEVEKSAHGIQDLLGHEVDVYYKENGSKKTIVFFEDGRNSTLKINAKNIVSMSGDTYSDNGTITYYTNTGKGTKTEKFHTDITLLYNGTSYNSYDLSSFNKFDAPDNYDGYVELIDSGDNGSYDYIVVKAYKTHVIKSTRDGVFYGAFEVSGNPDDKVIDLANYKERNINIRDISGEMITADDLKADQVINVFKDNEGNIKEIVASIASTDAKIDGVSYSDGKIEYVTIGGKNFYTSNSFSVNGKFDQGSYDLVKPGITATLYMNYDGEIAVIDTEKHSIAGYNFGFLIDAGRVGTQLDNSVVLKLLATDNKIYTYSLSKKVRLNDASSDGETILSTLLNGGSRAKRQVILYILDEDGKTINSVKIASIPTDGPDDDDELDFKNEFYQFPPVSYDADGKEQGYYESPLATVNGKYLFDSTTIAFKFPPEADRDKEDKYSTYTIGRTSADSKGSATSLKEMLVYGSNANGIRVRALAINDTTTGGTAPDEKTPIILVENVINALDDNGNPRLKVTAMYLNLGDPPEPKKITFYVDEKILGAEGGATTSNFIDINGNNILEPEEKTFAPGDVFKFANFGDSMEVNSLCFDQVYDYDTKTLQDKCAGSINGIDPNGIKGFYFKYSNNYQVGKVLTKDGTAIKIAYENDNNGTTTNDTYQRNVYELSAGYYKFVEVTKNPRTGLISVDVATPDSIYPADTFSDRPSKVLMHYIGAGYTCIIFNGEPSEIFR